MTKREIRILSISEMGLTSDSVVADIGAGTGSVAIEAALIADRGHVYAFEKKPEAVELIEANCRKFAVENLHAIQGRASENFGLIKKTLDAVFIGGSGGELSFILKSCREHLKADGRLVINAVVIENLNSALNLLDEHGYRDVNFIQVAVSRGRKLGKGHALEALNPVFIIRGTK